jgi:hypothetical protein
MHCGSSAKWAAATSFCVWVATCQINYTTKAKDISPVFYACHRMLRAVSDVCGADDCPALCCVLGVFLVIAAGK